jgi:hypothetical protein
MANRREEIVGSSPGRAAVSWIGGETVIAAAATRPRIVPRRCPDREAFDGSKAHMGSLLRFAADAAQAKGGTGA